VCGERILEGEIMPVAIVTGGGGALGKGISIALAAAGWRIVIADMVPEFAQETAAALGSAAAPTIKILDVTDLAAVQKTFADVAEKHGRIDALVNAAGGALALRVEKGPLVDNRPLDWDKMIGVNLYGTFNCCHTAAKYMKAAKKGGIVSIASGAGMRGGPPASRQSGAAVYSATKAGVIAFTQALAQELGPHGIRVNAVAPGRNESRDKPLAKMLEMQAEEEASEPGSGRASPLIRFGTPADIGDAIAFLLSEQASYITGTCLDLTGGIRLH
jgi:NAD(P)-dependent dehydrogenase (short-subunit alcohol dehydrogenase family)